MAGFDDTDLDAATELLDQFRFLDMDRAVADEAARLRRHTRLKLPDAIQAAFAVHHQLQLVTRNSKDFRPETFNFVMIPYALNIGSE